MLCQIYFGMFLVVTPLCQSSESYNEDILGLATQTVSDALVRLDECLGNMERIKNERIREKLLKTNNKTSFQKLNYDDKSFSVPKEIQPIIEKIFPDLTSIYSIKDVLENFEKINYTDTTNIIPKLKQFKAWLLKKRKDINSITFRSCYLKLLYKEDKHKSNSLT
ncbi:uncharacterized protein LOC126906537 isoform X4 [Daktulosphaira vitifoliae]|uniref:uncharacterized protein LOC126906537 isoform X4 n=1 Tax=Daktulosphaira vitifoliae TaxID=58002 RepID=UPI0021A99E4D|nr:uncharacterized protein LOC126906537 isoform X4 [Daktulosphaira vitifoliae]